MKWVFSQHNEPYQTLGQITGEIARAKEVLEETGAEHVSSSGESKVDEADTVLVSDR